MEIKKVEINQLKPSEKNVRLHNEMQIQELKRSVEQFGQIRPIVTDENYVILAGHGLWETMKEMGKSVVDVLAVKGLTESGKKKLMLADNKVYELGATDLDSMMDIISEIKLDGEDLDIPGYDMGVLEALLAETEEVDKKINEYGNISETKKEELVEDKAIFEEKIVNPPKKEIVLNNDVIQVQQETSEERPRPFVICPNCGEKIWL